jgi:dCTP deaminase
MILSDIELLACIFNADSTERIQVGPIVNWKKQLQAASIDVRLGQEVVVFRKEMVSVLDLLSSDGEDVTRRLAQRTSVDPQNGFVVHPGDFLLATTFESIKLPANIAARLEGKSSWGRLGLQVHSTAGFIDPGFAGKVTFEISNVGTLPMKLYPGLLVAQVCFFRTGELARKVYGSSDSKYFGQLRTEPSKYYDDLEIKRFIAMRNANQARRKSDAAERRPADS